MWISVDKRLPKTADDKLVTVRDMYGHRRTTIGYYSKGMWCAQMPGTVIAWANLPRAYRGKR